MLAMLTGCSADPLDGAVRMSFTNELGNATRYASLSEDADPNTFMALSRKACERETSCFVYIWLGDAVVPTAWPMLPTEEASYVFKYQLKRNAGVERGFWDCSRYKREKSECIIR